MRLYVWFELWDRFGPKGQVYRHTLARSQAREDIGPPCVWPAEGQSLGRLYTNILVWNTQVQVGWVGG